MTERVKRYGASYPIGPEPDWSFLKNYPVEDSDESESPEALRGRIRQEILKELSASIATSTEPRPEPPQRAQHVRNPSYDEFFALLEVEKEARRRGR